MTLKYVTAQQFGDILGITNEIPSWTISGSSSNEAVGTGNGSNATFYLDQKNVVASSYTLYANAVAMTETTHYTLNKDTGVITLTATGITVLSTNALTAKYKYYSNGMSDSFITTVLGRAEIEVDNMLNTQFTDGTATNPSYPVETEYQPSEGSNMDRIITKKKPVIDIESTLNGALTISQITVDLAAGDGATFPTTGYIIVDSEVISYTGITTDQLTGCTRGALGTTAATHTTATAVHTTLIFRSDTDEGTAVSWTIQPWGTSMEVDENGLIYIYSGADPDNLSRIGVAKRIKVIYYYGHDTIPVDIIRLVLILGKRMLMQDNVSKSMIAGRNEFRPEMLNADLEEISRIVNTYIILPMGNT